MSFVSSLISCPSRALDLGLKITAGVAFTTLATTIVSSVTLTKVALTYLEYCPNKGDLIPTPLISMSCNTAETVVHCYYKLLYAAPCSLPIFIAAAGALFLKANHPHIQQKVTQLYNWHSAPAA
jgi:hypothetical protein